MDQNTDIKLEAKRLRLLAAVLDLQHYTSTESNIVPIPGGDRVIAIGTPAQIAQLLPEVRDQVLVEARDACERVQDEYCERQSGKWPELRDDAETGARDCVAAIEALRVETSVGDGVEQ
jgi:hypothetical protein